MICEIDYKFDIDYLVNLFVSNVYKVKKFEELDGNIIDKFYILKMTDDLYINDIVEKIGFEARPRFLFMKTGCHLPLHIDANTQCAINIYLGLEDDPDPIIIRGENHYYRQAVIDVTKLHTVNVTKDRLIFKFSFFNNSYDELIDRLKELEWII